jgi:hypothetical protein
MNTWERSKHGYLPNGSDPKAFEGAAFLGKRPDVAERGMDEEVHGFVTDSLPPLNTRVRSTMPFVPNGSDPSAHDGVAFSERRHHNRHHKRPDVAERGMDEEVHGFVVDSLPPLNTWERSKTPFVPNGSDPSAHDGAAFSERRHHKRHHKRDVAERGMDEEVHGFVTDSLPPLNTRVRSTMPFIPNGSDPSSHEPGYKLLARDKRDIAERGMDSDVWGFSSEAIPPMTTKERAAMPFIPNGSENVWPQSFVQKPDIAERSMDETWVHPFTSGLDVVLPTANPWTRPYLPYNTNGGNNVYSQLEAPVAAPIPKKDIANSEVRPDVYVTVHKLINPVAMGRFREPRPDEAPEERTWDDGPKPKDPPKPEFKFKPPKEVDEEAVMSKRKEEAEANIAKGKAAKAKEDAASFKHDPEEKAKKEEKEEKTEEKEEKEEKKETPKEKEAKALEEADAAKKAAADAKEAEAADEKKKKPEEALNQKKKLAQVANKEDGDKKEEKKEEKVAAPEKVHVLEPEVYQNKANTNTPNLRTTFYDKKSQKDQKDSKM